MPRLSASTEPRPVRAMAAARAVIVGVAAWTVACCGAAEPMRLPPEDQTRLEERRPEIYYLEDDAGRLVPVPGFRYRDFMDLLRLKEGLPGPAQPPAAVLEEIRVEADLTAVKQGTCPATATCTIRQARRGWVEVSLGCAGLVLARPPRHEGPGQALVEAAADGRGYRVWLDATPEAGAEARHVVTLEGRLAVDAAADREALVVHLPVATVSTVELASNRRDPDVVVQPPPAERQVRPRDAGALVRLAGLSGATAIRLGARGTGADRPPVAEAAVESVVRIDGRDAVTQARIRLGNLADPAPTVRITLPPAAVLRGIAAPAVEAGRGGTPAAPFVDVAVMRDADGGAVVELECQRPLERAAAAAVTQPVEIAGFGVVGIEPWRQWGRISLVVEGEWQAVWTEGLRRVDPPAAGRRPGLVAAFAYDAQPASLEVQVVPRQSRVVIEPEYRYDVAAERVAVQARLRVAASGAPAGEIVLAIDPAWQIDEVGPAGVVDIARVTSGAGRLTIPFAQPLAGSAVVEFRGSRPIARAEERLAWAVPVPQSGVTGPATVLVGADSDIELLPDTAAIKGLVRQTAAALTRADTEEVVLAYRMDGKAGTFAATRRYLLRRVEAELAIRAAMDAAATVVTETIRLDVKHVPLEYIELLVPEAVAAAGGIELRQDEWVLDPVEVPPAEELAPGGGGRRMRAILPTQLLGPGELVVRYSLPAPAVPEETTLDHGLPLVLPLGANVERQTFTLTAPDRLAVDVRGEAWRRDAPPPAAPATRVWSTTRSQDAVPLTLAARMRAAAAGLAIDASVLRTTLLPDRREDLFAYAISGAADRVEVLVPTGASEIRVDGRPVAVQTRADGRVAIDLPTGSGGRWLLEIGRRGGREDGWDRVAARLGLPVRILMEPPRFGPDVVERRFYWEVDVRPDEWVFGAPAAWTSQQRWEWRGLVPDRAPTVSRRELTAWVRTAGGQRADTPEPEPAGRRCVYSGVGGPGPAAPWLVPTWFLVFVCSGATLAAGMAGCRVPILQRPAAVLAGAVVVCLAVAAAPDVAPLAVITSLPGLALVGLDRLLQRVTRSADEHGESIAAPPTASSLTRAVAPPPSLLIGNAAQRGDSAAAAERSVR